MSTVRASRAAGEDVEDCVACLRELRAAELFSARSAGISDPAAIPRSEISAEDGVALDAHIVEHGIGEELLFNALQAIQRIAESSAGAEGSSVAREHDLFESLSRGDVPLAGMVALLYRLAEKRGRRAATLAARCYLALLSVPGADAYGALYPMVLRACLRPVATLSEAGGPGERRQGGKGKENAQPADPMNVPLPIARGGKGKGKGKAAASAPGSDEEGAECEGGGSGDEGCGKGRQEAREAARELLRDLRACVGRLPLAGGAGEAAAHLVEALVPPRASPRVPAPPGAPSPPSPRPAPCEAPLQGARPRAGAEKGCCCEGDSLPALACGTLAELCRACPAPRRSPRPAGPPRSCGAPPLTGRRRRGRWWRGGDGAHADAARGALPQATLAVRSRALSFLPASALAPLRPAPPPGAPGVGRPARARFDAFLRRLSRHPRGPHRLFAVELAAHLWAAAPRRCAPPGVPEAPAELQVVMGRLSDKAPAVRAKALAALAACLQLAAADPPPPTVRAGASPECLERGAALDGGVGGGDAGAGGAGRDVHAVQRGLLGAGGQPLRALLRRRALDDRPAVRKAALQVVEALAGFEPGALRPAGAGPEEDEAAFLAEACADPAPSVRRQALDSLSALVRAFPQEAALASAWLAAVLPAPCALVAALDADSARLVRRAARLLHRHARLPRPSPRPPRGRRPPEPPRGIWLLAEALSDVHPAAARPSPRLSSPARLTRPAAVRREAAARALGRRRPELAGAAARDAAPLLRTLASCAERLPAAPAAALCEELVAALGRFELSPDAIAAALACISRVPAPLPARPASRPASLRPASGPGERGEGRAEARGGCRAGARRCWRHRRGRWCRTRKRWTGRGRRGPPPRLVQHLFTLGELSLVRSRPAPPTRPPRRLAPERRPAPPRPQICEAGAVPEALVTAVQALVAAPAPAEEAGGDEEAAEPPRAARPPAPGFPADGPRAGGAGRAHAVLALGKLCVRDGALAKRCVPALVRELAEARAPAVRNNVLLCMADLCVRYTAVVDGYMPRLALLLRDPVELVRRHALLLLSSLLHADYLKWRHELFFRFLVALEDPSPEIRSCARRVLREVGARKQPAMLCSHFVEALYHLNACVAHPAYNQFVRGDGAAVQAAFDLSSHGPVERAAAEGPAARRAAAEEAEGNEGRRWAIYGELLGAMREEERLTVAARLVSEVVAPRGTGRCRWRPPACAASSPTPSASSPPGPAPAPAPAPPLALTRPPRRSCARRSRRGRLLLGPKNKAAAAAAAAAAAKAKLLAAAARKLAGESVVPALVALRAVLQRARSPLQGALHACLRETVKAHALDLGGAGAGPAGPRGPRAAAKGKGKGGRAEKKGKGRAAAEASESDGPPGAAGCARAPLTPSRHRRRRLDGGEEEEDGERRRRESLSLLEREREKPAPPAVAARARRGQGLAAEIDELAFTDEDAAAPKGMHMLKGTARQQVGSRSEKSQKPPKDATKKQRRGNQ
eukprot:tig00020961_g16764.t1